MRDARVNRIRRRALGWSLLALLSGLALSILVAREHARLIDDDQRGNLTRVVERTVAGLRDQLQTCGILIRAVQTLFMTSDEVTADEFQRIYVNLNPKEEFNSLVAVAYARRVLEERAGGLPPRVSFPTEMVAPLDGNQRLLGLDVASQPANLRGAELSRDSNVPALSARFRLVQRQDQLEAIDGVTLRLPVYARGDIPESVEARRARFVGTLAVSFRVSELIRTALPAGVEQILDVRVTDVGAEPGDQLLYLSGDPKAWESATGTAAFYDEVAYGGRVWRIELRPTPGWNRTTRWIPWVTFAIAAAASLLLALLIWVLANRRERALAMAQDLSARFRESEARFRSLNELLPVAVALAPADSGDISYLNQSGRRLLGLEVNETARHPLADVFDDEQLAAKLRGGDPGLRLDGYNTLLRNASGDRIWGQVSLASLDLDGGRHYLAVISDVTEFRALTERLGHQSSHDGLTELFHRREFERRLEIAVQDLDRVDASGALLYLDLDQFKLINDTSGHVAGDALLAHLAVLLSAQIEAQHTLARLGGDEFGLLLEGVDATQAVAVAERIRNAVDDFVFSWEGKTYSVTVSIGIVMLSQSGRRSLRELLSLADTACYMAKERGRNRLHLYSETDLETTRRRGEMEWVNRLKRALVDGRFVLYYQELQALQSLPDADGVHFELLVRLRDEQGELVPPGAFIPAAERYNLMPQLDRWVVHTALSNFSRLHPDGADIALCAINLSGNTLEDEDFPDFVTSELASSGVEPRRVCFEITETAAVGSMARVVQFIQKLRAKGCRFALDDFGVGMSSFGYLKNLPIDFIKIDGSFIREIESDSMSYSIVRAVTDIGHQAGVAVVAEFVANVQQRDLLRGLGVDYAQGFSIHKPAPTGIV
jgi:diguanylate cyclase (GGDEF)-like protein